MKKNMALGERILRMAAGFILLVIILFRDLGEIWMYGMVAISFYLMTTAWIGHCPFYSVFKIDTRQFKETDEIEP